MIRWFLDTEFNDNGKTIELISIALVSEDRNYYAVASEGWSDESCSQWVKDHVLIHLPPANDMIGSMAWKTRDQIANDVVRLIGNETPEIYGYYSAYDWVVFCQLFGPMVSLPRNFPRHCVDLRQRMKERGVSSRDLPIGFRASRPHDALKDAQWNLELWKYLESLQYTLTPVGKRLDSPHANKFGYEDIEQD